MKNYVTKKLKNFSAEEKRKYLIFPFIAALCAIGALLSFSDASSNDIKVKAVKENLEMPEVDKKELSKDKSKVSDEIDKNNLRISKNKKSDFYSVYNEKSTSDLSKTNSDNDLSNTRKDYKSGDKELIRKVQEQLKKLEEKKETKRLVKDNLVIPKFNGVNNSVTTIKKGKSKEQKLRDFKNRNKKESEVFFNSPSAQKKENTNNSSQNNLQTDSEIFGVVYRDQNIINRGRVSLRLGRRAVINGIKYDRNTIFFGFARFAQNRIFIQIDKINSNSVSLMAYDAQDGNEGIYTEVDFKNLIKENVKNDIESDIEIGDIPIGNTIKNIFKSRRGVDKVLLFNEYKLILKSKK